MALSQFVETQPGIVDEHVGVCHQRFQVKRVPRRLVGVSVRVGHVVGVGHRRHTDHFRTQVAQQPGAQGAPHVGVVHHPQTGECARTYGFRRAHRMRGSMRVCSLMPRAFSVISSSAPAKLK